MFLNKCQIYTGLCGCMKSPFGRTYAILFDNSNCVYVPKASSKDIGLVAPSIFAPCKRSSRTLFR